MPRRYSSGKSRQAANRLKSAVRKLQADVRRHNQQVRTAVNKCNQAVRNYNFRVRANQQRLRSELARLSRTTTSRRVIKVRVSTQTLHQSFVRLERHADSIDLGSTYDHMVDLSEREMANSVAVANVLEGEQPTEEVDGLENDALGAELKRISPDLDRRWRGAVFSLNPSNPDASRHFCASAREIFTQILEFKASDQDVVAWAPDCERTDQGTPSRRAKIRYMLHQKNLLDDPLEDFIGEDMDDIVGLFRSLNKGTHGDADVFDARQLHAIRKRVEDGILFLTKLAI